VARVILTSSIVDSLFSLLERENRNTALLKVITERLGRMEQMEEQARIREATMYAQSRCMCVYVCVFVSVCACVCVHVCV